VPYCQNPDRAVNAAKTKCSIGECTGDHSSVRIKHFHIASLQSAGRSRDHLFAGRFTQKKNVRVRKLPWGEVKVVPELIATPCGFENFPRVDHEPNSAKPTLGGSRGHGSGPGVTPRYGARPSHVAHAARSDARVTSLSSQLKQLVILSGLIIGPNYRVKIRVLQYIRTRITLSKYGIPSRSSRTNSSYGACSGLVHICIPSLCD
jgi:hypothetical protein